MLSLETVSCLKTVLRQFFSVLVLVLRVGVLVLVSVLGWCHGSKKQDSLTTRKNNTVGFQFFSTTTKKEASSYIRPPVQSDTSAASPDATLAAYITAINLDDFNPDDRPNIFAEQKYLALQELIAKLFFIPATPRPPLWNVFSQGGRKDYRISTVLTT